MQRVFVLDTNKQPLMPCSPARARQLLKAGKAAVYRRYPFTIIMKERVGGDTQDIEAKIDPGSKTTGLALVGDFKRGKRLIWAGELNHRGTAIHMNMTTRSAIRRSRRNRHTRYRPARFNNRTRRDGWLPPSLKSRVDNVVVWVGRLRRYSPVTSIVQELVRFDTQLMENAEISGVEYQQGELAGYEVRQYLLEKWGRKCAYCGKENIPLQVEHIIPRAQGGSNRVSNLCVACEPCNQTKGNRTATEFGYPDIQNQAKRPMQDIAAVNTTRWALWRALSQSELPVSIGSGGLTKFNRAKQGYPKTHWIDAACVGASGSDVMITPNHQALVIKATGRGSRQVQANDKYGFPRGIRKGAKRRNGFQTGDFVKAIVPKGKNVGVHTGRAVLTENSIEINRKLKTFWRNCQIIQRFDGYAYLFPPITKE